MAGISKRLLKETSITLAVENDEEIVFWHSSHGPFLECPNGCSKIFVFPSEDPVFPEDKIFPIWIEDQEGWFFCDQNNGGCTFSENPSSWSEEQKKIYNLEKGRIVNDWLLAEENIKHFLEN